MLVAGNGNAGFGLILTTVDTLIFFIHRFIVIIYNIYFKQYLKLLLYAFYIFLVLISIIIVHTVRSLYDKQCFNNYLN